jgi:hypothetical protein
MPDPRTVRIVASDPASQGAFVTINEDDFDAATQELFDENAAPAAKPLTVAQLRDELFAKGVSIPDDAKKADLAALYEAAQVA